MDFEKVTQDAGMPLVNGKFQGKGRSFSFFPKNDDGKRALGQVIQGSIKGMQRTFNDTLVLFVNIAGDVVVGEMVALHYFHGSSLEIALGTVPEVGWYLQSTSTWDSSKVTFWRGNLKWV